MLNICKRKDELISGHMELHYANLRSQQQYNTGLLCIQGNKYSRKPFTLILICSLFLICVKFCCVFLLVRLDWVSVFVSLALKDLERYAHRVEYIVSDHLIRFSWVPTILNCQCSFASFYLTCFYYIEMRIQNTP